jgi:phage major head subunit gpT-like protein
MDPRDYKLALLAQSRPDAPNVWAREDKPADDAVIEAAVCIAAGISKPDKYFPDQTLDAAHKRWRNGLSLGELVLTYARRNGYQNESIRQNLRGALKAAFFSQDDIRAAGSWGPSTGGGLSGVLSNTANKFLRDSFDAVESVWRDVAAITSVNDFKAVTGYSLTGDLQYDKLAPGGEIKHGQLGAETYTTQVDTYAKMLGIDRRDLINDDLGAFTRVTRRLGRGGALKINDVFWGVFLNNTSFFTAGRNNLVTSNALSLAGLDAAYQKFVNQTDPDGKPMSIRPAILLVPPGLGATARTLMSSTALVSGATTAPGTPSNNVWAGMFQVVESPYLANTTYTGSSTTSWYLLARPADAPVVELAFLNGQQSPTVESAEADFGMLGIAFRGYHDFGAALQEYRAGVRNNS